VVVVRDSVAVHPLPRSGDLVLGRGDDCDIRVDDASVSRRHAILRLGRQLRIEDLGSVNGTFLSHQRDVPAAADTHALRELTRQSLELALGQRVNLGLTTIAVRLAQPIDGARAAGGAAVVLRDPQMIALYEQASLAGKSDIPVLLLGETGVGKEVLARAIHDVAIERRGPFLGLNCAALPESLLEAELFGHEKGVFTGADQARAGLFEEAAGGTLFLDEVGELPLSVQVKLLRVLEDKEILRVGGRKPRRIDVRFVAATNRDIESEIERGGFRSDLYYRLSGLVLTIPPLRERGVEIVSLAELFIERACQKLNRAQPPTISPEACEQLERYGYPGNVRELRNVIDRAVLLCGGDAILPSHLPDKLRLVTAPALPTDAMADTLAGEPSGDTPSDTLGALKLRMQEVERKRILDALERCGGNQTRAAEALGISRRTLVTRLGEYGIKRPRKRD
jgi:DNA-binding NtrC family response regulator